MGRCWSSLSAGGLPADKLVQLRWVGEGPGVLPKGLEPRDCSVQVAGWSPTSWFTLFSSSLCRSEPLRSRVMAGFGGRVGLVDYGVQRNTSMFLRERKND